ncbi:hypothetical protein NCC78_22040 [Micromonospora phytophila]|uniref:hypothetical protein n=1 Tax=Micromonospora phytophila TaxID=709888 RepID=UPI00202F859E|nr:hypothetical protein [Micromonospora phytophila]MCM0677349.1 hypothetical protein [Micromonospora phytophila]
MRTMLWVVGVVAAALILLGLLLEAVRWLVIIGLIALVAVIVLAVVKGRQGCNVRPDAADIDHPRGSRGRDHHHLPLVPPGLPRSRVRLAAPSWS